MFSLVNKMSKEMSSQALIPQWVENLATALVPSAVAWRASSPGRRSLTAVWTSRAERVWRLLYLTRREDSPEILSETSPMKEFMMLMDFLEMPISGWTYLRTR